MAKFTLRAFATLVILFCAGAQAYGQSLPAGWSTADIGAVGAAGSATAAGSTFTVAGAGADVWGTTDAFRFAYRTMTGDGSIVTRVTATQWVSDWTKAGAMMRETLTPGARHAFMLVSPGKGLAFQRRTGANGESSHSAGGSGAAPHYVRLTRVGNTFTAARSLDGVTWTTVGSDNIPMSATIYVGVAVSSHVTGVTAAATFASTVITSPLIITEPPITPSASLRLLHWNAHHGGVGTDGRYDPARFAALVATINPDVVSLNEVDDTTQVAAILNSLNAKTAGGWKSYAAWKTVFMTRMTVNAASPCLFDAAQGWRAAHLSVMVNGRGLNIWTTHLDVASGANRTREVGAMQACANAWPEAHIIAGDFNMQYGSAEYNAMAATYTDAWLAAKGFGTATNYPGNCDGCTRNSRIDYVFSSKAQAIATVTSAAVLDSRDASGVMPSDHKPLLVTFAIK